MVKKEYRVLKFNQVEWPKLPFSSIIVINLKLQHKVSDPKNTIVVWQEQGGGYTKVYTYKVK